MATILLRLPSRRDRADELGRVTRDDGIFLHVLPNDQLVFQQSGARMSADTHPCDHGASPNNRAATNRAVWLDGGICADEDIVFDQHGASDDLTLTAFARGAIDAGRQRVDLDIRPDNDPVANGDVRGILQVASRLQHRRTAQVDVVPVITFEWRLDDGVIFDRTYGRRRLLLRALSAVDALIWVQNLREETLLRFPTKPLVAPGALIVAVDGDTAGISLANEKII